MQDAGLVVEAAADAGLEPRSSALCEAAGRQHEIDFLRRMRVIGIADVRLEQRNADPDIAAAFDAAGPDEHRVRMAVFEAGAGAGLGAATASPGHLRLERCERLAERHKRRRSVILECRQRRRERVAGRQPCGRKHVARLPWPLQRFEHAIQRGTRRRVRFDRIERLGQSVEDDLKLGRAWRCRHGLSGSR